MPIPDGFLDEGFAIFKAEDRSPLDNLRADILNTACDLLGCDDRDAGAFMNTFHQRNLSGAELNEFRLGMINHMTANADVGQIIFQSFHDVLLNLVGPDVVVQRTMNLVIHQPGDAAVAPLHRDAPINSPFEVVVWLPLVDCAKTKGMLIVDKPTTLRALDALADDGTESGYARLEEITITEGIPVDVPYGHACFFWPGLLHFVPVNEEPETRWSINIRFKNLFSPYGSKGLPEFFEVLHLSPLGQLAFEFEAKGYVPITV